IVIASVFFFQAEDGIRDFHVTGVQTCALPISTGTAPVEIEVIDPERYVAAPPSSKTIAERKVADGGLYIQLGAFSESRNALGLRSEERRVGKEGGARWATYLAEASRQRTGRRQ